MYKEEYESYTEPWQLKKLRESYGVSVNQLAQVCHVSFETIKRIEHTSKHENVGGGVTRYKPQTYQEVRRALINYVSNMKFDGRKYNQKIIFRNGKAYCEQAGISQRDFAKQAVGDIKLFEHPLSIMQIEKILRFLNCTMDELENGIPVFKAEVNPVEIKEVIPHDKILDTINNYCKENDISKQDLALMCGLYDNAFAPSCIRTFKEDKIQKILDATGWTKDQLYGIAPIESVEVKKEDEVMPAAVATVNKVEFPDGYSFQDTQEEKNKTYTVVIGPDGNKQYVCEFDVVQTRHIRKVLSREEFLKEV